VDAGFERVAHQSAWLGTAEDLRRLIDVVRNQLAVMPEMKEWQSVSPDIEPVVNGEATIRLGRVTKTVDGSAGDIAALPELDAVTTLSLSGLVGGSRAIRVRLRTREDTIPPFDHAIDLTVSGKDQTWVTGAAGVVNQELRRRRPWWSWARTAPGRILVSAILVAAVAFAQVAGLALWLSLLVGLAVVQLGWWVVPTYLLRGLEVGGPKSARLRVGLTTAVGLLLAVAGVVLAVLALI
jgi:hypothetical protein